MGGSRGKKSRVYAALENLMRRRLAEDDMWAIIVHGANTPSQSHLYDDPAAALLLSAIVDQSLEHAISAHFVIDEAQKARLFQESPSTPGVLSQFSHKIIIAHALGVYDDKVRTELDNIRRIRNAFAHPTGQFSFDHEVVSLVCESLFIPNLKKFGGF